MIRSPSPSRRWRKVGKDLEALRFLRSREPYCVAAASRFCSGACDDAWAFQDSNGMTAGLLLNSKGSLFPIFNGNPAAFTDSPTIPLPRFVNTLVKRTALHSAQGVRRDVEILEAGLRLLGVAGAEKIEFDLMSIDRPPNQSSLSVGPASLILRPPNGGDTEVLYRLHAAYEQEEVVPPGAVFYPAACRLVLEHLIVHERILVAELGGRIIGKINTNAAGFSRRQIGGVYVLPEYRGIGIATRLTAALVQTIRADGQGITLFVKKQNLPARLVYRKVGFTPLKDYRITYF